MALPAFLCPAPIADDRPVDPASEAGRYVRTFLIQRMFVGVPPGAYDRLLDFSTAITGTTFFVPTAGMLDVLAELPSEPVAATADAAGTDWPTAASASLGIGSLRGRE